MQLRSSRGGEDVAFLKAIDLGIAPDGGLFVPVGDLRLPPPPTALSMDFQATAAWALRHLLAEEIETPVLDRLVAAAFDFPVPVGRLGAGPSLLNLTRGPTRAFKDIGARFLAGLWALNPVPLGRTVLVATSGDTGGAVADACAGLPGIRVVVLFPERGVSSIQRRQFTTLGGNVFAVAVEGPFDRCQALVKEAFGDPALTSAHQLTSANSINIGRILPQILPYLHLARLNGWSVVNPEGQPGTVVVPSGNLGNVWGAMMARRAGAPLGQVVAACNRNDTLVRWLNDRSCTAQPSVPTPSSAMDVGRPSNLERVSVLMDQGEALSAHTVSDSETHDAIRKSAAAGRVVDPHTAVGLVIAEQLIADGMDPASVTVVETASPAKFPEVLAEAGVAAPTDPVLLLNEGRPERILTLSGGGSLSALLAGMADDAGPLA